jgi:hypothetical protein
VNLAKSKKTDAQRSREYKKRQRESHENNLHPDSIAMENPQFTPQNICPPEGQPIVRADDLVSPESNLTPLYIRTTSNEASENQTLEESIELPITQNFRRRGITAGERQTLLARRNLQFESNIGRKHMVSSDETPSVDGDPTQSTVINPGEYVLFLNMVWSTPISLFTKTFVLCFYRSIVPNTSTPHNSSVSTIRC